MAVAPQDPARRLLVFGVNHRSATAALRERLMIEEIDQPSVLSEIGASGVDEVVVLATCDRLEFVALSDDPEAAVAPLLRFVAERAQVTPEEMTAQSYRYFGEAALRHVFAVAASLDSQIVGEPQVLGQVKECHRLAVEAGALGAGLEAILQGAYGVAKRVRSETSVAERPVSVAAAARLVARNLHGDLGRCRCLLLGLGEMGDLMALGFKDDGLADLVVMHASAGRAEAAAHRLRAHFRPWEELDDALAEAEIVVTAVGSGRYTVTAPIAEAALKRRRQRPILFIDSAVPGDVDPAVEELDGAFAYDLDDLEGVAREGKANRETAAIAAWQVLDEELAAFLRQRAERAAAPTVTALRRHFDAVRGQVLAEGALDAEAATRLLIKRLLHDPSEVLRAAAAGDPAAGRTLERTVERLFRLDRNPADADRGNGGERET
jgi:glutamyl-tRNA reductase